MNLTTAQKQALKAWVVSNNASVFDESAVTKLNALASPNYYILKTSLSINEIMENGYDWTIVDNETVGQARIWDRMTILGTIKPVKTFIMNGIGEAYKGNSPAGTQAHRRAIYQHCCTRARVWEKLFCVASVSWTVGSNADLVGVRGANVVSPYAFNPDTPGFDADGSYLFGLIDLATVIDSESV